jgi:hypothetical protein
MAPRGWLICNNSRANPAELRGKPHNRLSEFQECADASLCEHRLRTRADGNVLKNDDTTTLEVGADYDVAKVLSFLADWSASK